MDDRVERAAEAIWRRHQSQFTSGPAVPSVALPQTWGDVSDRQKRKFREQAEDAITAASVPHERSEDEQTERPGAVDPYTKGLHAGREEMRERAAVRAAAFRGWPRFSAQVADAIRALPLQAEGEDTPHG